LQHEYDFGLIEKPEAGAYDAVIIGVPHKEYSGLDEAYFKNLMKDGRGVVVDIKGLYRNKIKELSYWSL
jgi:UDP-N-acetyl-D-galactosamine dehydrogenase